MSLISCGVMRPVSLGFILCLGLLFSPGIKAQASTATPRGMFVTVIDEQPVLASKDRINELVEFSHKARIKTLYVQIYRANHAWFPSRMADQAFYKKALNAVGEDPFAYLIKQAHARDIRVHAWLNMLSLSKNTRAPLLKKYGPSILTRNLQPKVSLKDYEIDGQYFLEPGDLRVREELADMVEEVVRGYPALDGIQFDYIRYPDAHPAYGHTERNVARFRKASGLVSFNEGTPAWRDWKRGQVTALLRELVRRAHAINSKLHLSTTGCMSYSRAYDEAFQDWPVWIDKGYVEFVTAMSYPDTKEEFLKDIEDARKRVRDFRKVYLATPAYKFPKTPDVFIGQFDLCRASGAGACVIFHYGSLTVNPAMKQYIRNIPKTE